MGACCQQRAEFSKSIDQHHMAEILAEERKKYDTKILELEENYKKDSAKMQLEGKDQSQISEALNEKDIKPHEVLKIFIEGITEVQTQMKNGHYDAFQKLGVLLDEYFSHASESDTTNIKATRAKLQNFFKTETKAEVFTK